MLCKSAASSCLISFGPFPPLFAPEGVRSIFLDLWMDLYFGSFGVLEIMVVAWRGYGDCGDRTKQSVWCFHCVILAFDI